MRMRGLIVGDGGKGKGKGFGKGKGISTLRSTIPALSFPPSRVCVCQPIR